MHMFLNGGRACMPCWLLHLSGHHQTCFGLFTCVIGKEITLPLDDPSFTGYPLKDKWIVHFLCVYGIHSPLSILLKSNGGRAFCIDDPRLWNRLALIVRFSSTPLILSF